MKKVSIIIPVCGQSHLTQRCLETLYQHTPKELFEAIVIDNNSPDDTLEMLKQFPEAKIVTNEMNQSFSISINQGVNESESELILALNNDTYFFQPWLEKMIAVFMDKKAGVAGAKLLFPDGRIQHAGVACYKNRQPYHPFWGEMPSEKTDIIAEYPAVTFACALIRRKVFEELRGLCLDYPDGNYEDVDFCLRARQQGYKVVYQPGAVLYHEEAATKKLDPIRARHTLITNLKIYKEKWSNKPDKLFEVDKRIFPKVLVGCPTYERYKYCLESYTAAAMNIMYPNYDILLVDNSEGDGYAGKIEELGLRVEKISYRKKARERIVESRNLIRKMALKGGYDYLLSLEQDVIPQPDIIQKLLARNKKIISAMYFNRLRLNNGEIVLKPVLYKFHKKEGKWGKCRLLTESEVWSKELINVAYAGLGCMLISRDILEEIEFRYNEGMEATDDRFFCFDARKNDHEIWADTSIRCKHLIEEKFDWDELREKGEY